jgi:hypothetical protein
VPGVVLCLRLGTGRSYVPPSGQTTTTTTTGTTIVGVTVVVAAAGQGVPHAQPPGAPEGPSRHLSGRWVDLPGLGRADPTKSRSRAEIGGMGFGLSNEGTGVWSMYRVSVCVCVLMCVCVCFDGNGPNTQCFLTKSSSHYRCSLLARPTDGSHWRFAGPNRRWRSNRIGVPISMWGRPGRTYPSRSACPVGNEKCTSILDFMVRRML